MGRKGAERQLFCSGWCWWWWFGLDMTALSPSLGASGGGGVGRKGAERRLCAFGWWWGSFGAG
ncbi:hypothetical protein Ate01nite_59560 [Actinoplanes teichomyceticus]|nr:hypothetical protein Ate01nite_59560 [Actinoplanes teichomyceticus]